MDDADYDLAEEWVSDYSDFHTISNQGSYTCPMGKEKKTPTPHGTYILYTGILLKAKERKKNYFENPHTTYNIFPFCGQ